MNIEYTFKYKGKSHALQISPDCVTLQTYCKYLKEAEALSGKDNVKDCIKLVSLFLPDVPVYDLSTKELLQLTNFIDSRLSAFESVEVLNDKENTLFLHRERNKARLKQMQKDAEEIDELLQMLGDDDKANLELIEKVQDDFKSDKAKEILKECYGMKAVIKARNDLFKLHIRNTSKQKLISIQDTFIINGEKYAIPVSSLKKYRSAILESPGNFNDAYLKVWQYIEAMNLKQSVTAMQKDAFNIDLFFTESIKICAILCKKYSVKNGVRIYEKAPLEEDARQQFIEERTAVFSDALTVATAFNVAFFLLSFATDYIKTNNLISSLMENPKRSKTTNTQ